MARTAASVPFATRAIVLRVRPLGEKDRIATVFAPDIGRFGAVARGARATKSKLAAVAQPFVSGRFLFARGRSLDTLTQVEIENAHFHLATHALGGAWATYCCELCDALPERHPEPEIFHTLSDTLSAMDALCAENAENATLILIGHWFEIRFLALLGYPSQIGRCVECERKIVVPPGNDTRTIAFSPQRGGTLCEQCARLDAGRMTPSVATLRRWHALERMESATQVLAGELPSPKLLGELRDLLRRQITTHLDMRLRSRRFLDDVSQAL